MQSLEKLSLQELRNLCKKCDIPVTSNKSQVFLVINLPSFDSGKILCSVFHFHKKVYKMTSLLAIALVKGIIQSMWQVSDAGVSFEKSGNNKSTVFS